MKPPAASQIRPMRPHDLPQVMQLAQSLRDAPHWTPAAWRAILQPEAAPRRVALVAVDPAAGAINGLTVAVLIPPQAELESIAVSAEAQRQGVGRQLFAALALELARAEIHEIWLEVRASNQAARAFYGALNFAETGQRPGYYTDPQEDAVLMTLRLR